MRGHLGAEFPLMVDANMRWSVDEAIRAARALQELNPVWLEEPTIPDDVPGHVRIVREGGLPIAAGENLHTLHEFRALIAAGGVTFPEPDVTNGGGITSFMKICHLAEAFNLPVTSHGAHDNGPPARRCPEPFLPRGTRDWRSCAPDRRGRGRGAGGSVTRSPPWEARKLPIPD
jgi:L-alanine-DL-glutamate epimerase-like enolase superfamily enzyme